MCSGFEAGSYLRLIDFVYHSTLGLRVINKKKKRKKKKKKILALGRFHPDFQTGFLSQIHSVRA